MVKRIFHKHETSQTISIDYQAYTEVSQTSETRGERRWSVKFHHNHHITSDLHERWRREGKFGKTILKTGWKDTPPMTRMKQDDHSFHPTHLKSEMVKWKTGKRIAEKQCKHGSQVMQARLTSNASAARKQCKCGSQAMQAWLTSNASVVHKQCKRGSQAMQVRLTSNASAAHKHS